MFQMPLLWNRAPGPQKGRKKLKSKARKEKEKERDERSNSPLPPDGLPTPSLPPPRDRPRRDRQRKPRHRLHREGLSLSSPSALSLFFNLNFASFWPISYASPGHWGRAAPAEEVSLECPSFPFFLPSLSYQICLIISFNFSLQVVTQIRGVNCVPVCFQSFVSCTTLVVVLYAGKWEVYICVSGFRLSSFDVQ